MLKPLINLINALSANTHPGAIAHGFALGMLLGFMPKTNLLWYIILVFILFIRIQKSCYTLSIIIGSLIAPLLDPVFNETGIWLLTRDSLVPAIRFLQDIPFVAYTRFHNSIVAGSLVWSLICYVPFYIIARLSVSLWRKYLAVKVRELKLIKMIKQVPLIQKVASMLGD